MTRKGTRARVKRRDMAARKKAATRSPQVKCNVCGEVYRIEFRARGDCPACGMTRGQQWAFGLNDAEAVAYCQHAGHSWECAHGMVDGKGCACGTARFRKPQGGRR